MYEFTQGRNFLHIPSKLSPFSPVDHGQDGVQHDHVDSLGQKVPADRSSRLVQNFHGESQKKAHDVEDKDEAQDERPASGNVNQVLGLQLLVLKVEEDLLGVQGVRARQEICPQLFYIETRNVAPIGLLGDVALSYVVRAVEVVLLQRKG